MIDGARLLLSVFKLRIGVAIMLCTLAGAAAAPGPGMGPGALAVLALAVLLSSCAAGAFNQYAERDLDARMRRTRSRPFVTGRYSDAWFWPAGIVALLLAAVAAAALAANALAALFVFLGAFTYGVVYTLWLKRRTWLNIVIGGLAGSFAVLAGAAAVRSRPGAGAGDPGGGALPVDAAALLEPRLRIRGGLPAGRGADASGRGRRTRRGAGDTRAHRGPRRGVAAAVHLRDGLALPGRRRGGPAAVFLRGSLRLVREPGRAGAMANFHASLAQLGLLLLGTLADAAL